MSWKSSSQWCTIDIVKMFWPFQTHKNDDKLQHCVWCSSKDEKLVLYQFARMVIDLSDSPDLVRLVLLHNAEENKVKCPLVLDIMDQDTYMDDSGIFGDTEDEGIKK